MVPGEGLPLTRRRLTSPFAPPPSRPAASGECHARHSPSVGFESSVCTQKIPTHLTADRYFLVPGEGLALAPLGFRGAAHAALAGSRLLAPFESLPANYTDKIDRLSADRFCLVPGEGLEPS